MSRRTMICAVTLGVLATAVPVGFALMPPSVSSWAPQPAPVIGQSGPGEPSDAQIVGCQSVNGGEMIYDPFADSWSCEP